MTSLSNRQTLPIRTAGILPSLDNLHIVIWCNCKYLAISFVVIISAKINSPVSSSLEKPGLGQETAKHSIPKDPTHAKKGQKQTHKLQPSPTPIALTAMKTTWISLANSVSISLHLAVEWPIAMNWSWAALKFHINDVYRFPGLLVNPDRPNKWKWFQTFIDKDFIFF